MGRLEVESGQEGGGSGQEVGRLEVGSGQEEGGKWAGGRQEVGRLEVGSGQEGRDLCELCPSTDFFAAWPSTHCSRHWLQGSPVSVVKLDKPVQVKEHV